LRRDYEASGSGKSLEREASRSSVFDRGIKSSDVVHLLMIILVLWEQREIFSNTRICGRGIVLKTLFTLN
jgi:hypothetical protein